MSKIVCLTGGIGSGKTTVAKMFEQFGVPVYIADERAKRVMDTAQIVEKVQLLFESSVVENGKLNRKKIRGLVFQDSALLGRLNAIVHPAVAADFSEWLEQHQAAPFVIKESAILFETGAHASCYHTILVTAPEEVRIERVMKRDGVVRSDVVNIMNQQMPEDDKAKLSDFIIKNMDLGTVKNQVLEIIRSF